MFWSNFSVAKVQKWEAEITATYDYKRKEKLVRKITGALRCDSKEVCKSATSALRRLHRATTRCDKLEQALVQMLADTDIDKAIGAAILLSRIFTYAKSPLWARGSDYEQVFFPEKTIHLITAEIGIARLTKYLDANTTDDGINLLGMLKNTEATDWLMNAFQQNCHRSEVIVALSRIGGSKSVDFLTSQLIPSVDVTTKDKICYYLRTYQDMEFCGTCYGFLTKEDETPVIRCGACHRLYHINDICNAGMLIAVQGMNICGRCRDDHRKIR